MEKRIMKKHLFGTILVLAALAACNKEVETLTPAVDNGQEEVTPGKVTITFTAAIDEATRTTYEGDKIAHWAAGDAISVCVTNSGNTDYKIAKFEASGATDAGMEFTGEVEPGYTTIVSGVYPANDVYSSSPDNYFKDGAVKSIYLPNSYDLEDADDTGRFIPLIGSYDGESMTFSHFCSTMKVTLTNIPTDATVFTFTTNGKQIAGDFTLSDEGRMAMANQTSNNSVQFTFRPVLTERSFYIPIPDGQLTAGSYVTVEKTIENSNNEVLFKKVINSTPTFPRTSDNKDAIRILPAVACWTRNEDWNAYYYGTYKTDNGSIYKGVATENVSSPYYYALINENTFNNTYGGSVIEYLSSNSFAEAVGNATPRTGDRIFGYTTFAPGIRYIIIYGLDENNKFTGEYNCVKIERPVFATPEGWSISVVEGDSYPIKYKRPSGVQWQYVTVKASTFTTYSEDVEYLIYTYARSYKNQYEEDPTKRAPLAANYNLPAPTNAEGVEYVFVSFGIDQNYLPTGDYFLLDYTFEIPTDAYSAWLGKWTVVDNGSTQNTDTWTITRKQANHSYTVKGLLGYSSDYSFEIKFNEEDGALVFPSQIYNSSTTLTYWLVGSSNKAADHQQGEYDIMQASFNENDPDKATLVGLNPLKRYYTVSYNKSDGSYNGYYKVRYLPSTMTRVTE